MHFSVHSARVVRVWILVGTIIAVGSAAARAATTYYVCNQTGQTSPANTACNYSSLAAVDRAALAPGDTVSFAAGDVFSDSSLAPQSGATYTSYVPPQGPGPRGGGQAIISPPTGANGVDFAFNGAGASNVTIDDLVLDGGNAQTNAGDGVFSGNAAANPSTHVLIENSTIKNWSQGVFTGYRDDYWTIQNTTIDTVALNGIYFDRSADTGGYGPNGDVVTGSTITNTGLYPQTVGVHGIYDNSINSQITGNTITHFSSDGISVRFRNSTVATNTISAGSIGIAWFQYDPAAGTSTWTGNNIANVTTAGIFVCSSTNTAPCTPAIETFHIQDNTINVSPSVQCTNLEPTSGGYLVTGNTCGPTSPSIVSANGSYNVAYHGLSGDVATYSPMGGGDQGAAAAMMPGTNPAIAALGNGSDEVAFQGANGHLWTALIGGGGATDTGLAMKPNTSPSIAGLASCASCYEIAYQGSAGVLWTTGNYWGTSNTGLAMAPNASPSIASLTGGNNYEIAYDGSTGTLWATGNALGTKNTGVAVAANSSPSIGTFAGNTSYEIACSGSNGDLWTVSSVWGATNTGLAVVPDTSPSIATTVAGGMSYYEIAYAASNGVLSLTGNESSNGSTGVAMMPATSPSISMPPGSTNYEYAVQNGAGQLVTGHWDASSNTGEGMM